MTGIAIRISYPSGIVGFRVTVAYALGLHVTDAVTVTILISFKLLFSVGIEGHGRALNLPRKEPKWHT